MLSKKRVPSVHLEGGQAYLDNVQIETIFLPTVPGGGTVGQQMDFFFSSAFFSSFSSFTPPNWPKRGVKKTWPKRGVKKIKKILCARGRGGGDGGGGGGV